MIINYNDITSTQKYKVMSQSIIPRPIAWIVTVDNNIINVAPFSYFTPLSSNPPTVIVSIGHKDNNEPKDTLANIRKTKKATICFVNEIHLENMILSAQPLAKDISETTKFNIPTTDILDDYPPIIEGCDSAMFCNFHKEVELEGKTIPIILEIKSQYCNDNICDNNFNINLENISRIGKEFAISKKVKNDI
ncbi:MAG: flavin reductase family protein [Campylobacteraceae bacterium]|jgi:flavin reductase (DIM6/NTAB) family NADH-FMN oxidoreductase RutF|nr:flavin reductase family protein [Campylobacteraceae bacterium]MBT5324082.1 flavin reductase family protein [Campylobacteraceae bacterium]